MRASKNLSINKGLALPLIIISAAVFVIFIYWFFFIFSISDSCIQVIQEARNPLTGQVKTFPTPCDVPIGWKKITQINSPKTSPLPSETTDWKPVEPELTFEEAAKMPQIPPGNIIARKDNGKIIISWDSTESDQAAEYKVYGKSSDGKTWQFLGSVKYKVGKSTYELRTTSSATEFTVSTVSIYGVEGPQGNTAIVNY